LVRGAADRFADPRPLPKAGKPRGTPRFQRFGFMMVRPRRLCGARANPETPAARDREYRSLRTADDTAAPVCRARLATHSDSAI
jgi:hypothetical protein